MSHKERPSRRTFLASAAVAATTLPLAGACAQQFPANKACNTVEPGPGFQMDLWCLPRVQFWSFDNKDPLMRALGLAFSVQVFTTGADENTYSLHAGSLQLTGDAHAVVIRATQLTTAGQQQHVDGLCEVRLSKRGERISVFITATVEKESVRAVKLILRELPEGRIGFTSWEAVPNLAPVPPESLALSYPSYQGGSPVWFLAHNGERGVSFSSLDATPRPRRFVAAREPSGGSRIELIVEQDARYWSNSFAAPEWEILGNTTLDEAIESRIALLEKQAGMLPWERRTDMPPWVHDLGLVVCLHGMHWSGYVLNDYAAMRANIDWVTARIPGKHVLFFIAGWEGRYYRSYGNSVPHPRMGGDAGFHALIQGAHNKGAHVAALSLLDSSFGRSGLVQVKSKTRCLLQRPSLIG